MRHLTFAVVLLLAGFVSTAAAAQSAREHFAGVQRWRLTFDYAMNSPFTWTEGGVTTNRHTWTARQGGSIELVTTERSDDVIVAEGEAKVAANYNYAHRKTHSTGTVETRYDRGTGSVTMKVRVTFYFENNTYDVDFSAGDLNATYGGTEKSWSRDHKYGPLDQAFSINMPEPAPAEKVLKLPESGRTIADSWSWEERWNHEAKEQPDFDRARRAQVDPMSGRLNWRIEPAESIDSELLIEPQDGYDAWLPTGGRDENTAGNVLKIKATLVGLDGGAPPVKARRIIFTRSATSREPGVCLNRPLSDGATTPDLGFEADKNGEGAIGDEGGSWTTADGSLTEATATLSSFDFGAYGSVSVVAELVDGRRVVGKLKADKSQGELLVPKRSPTSAIADAWRSAVGFDGQDGDDEEKQEGNDRLGDGLAAFEEYRGLVSEGRHLRANPIRKELVVINTIGGPAKRGLALFTSASGIDVIPVKKGELPESRRVNVNAGTATGGAQHAVLLIDEAIASGNAGENRPVELLGKTPVKSQMAVVDLASAASYYKQQAAVAKKGGVAMPYTLEEDIANTVAHEIAHGIGAPHHGKKSEFKGLKGKRTVTPKMTSYPVFDAAGNPVTIPPDGFELKGEIGLAGSDASGDASCIMCYTNYYNWAAVGPVSGPWQFRAVGPQPVGTRFCTGREGTGMNAPRKIGDRDVPSLFGPAAGQGNGAPVGNCLGAMNVRDW